MILFCPLLWTEGLTWSPARLYSVDGQWQEENTLQTMLLFKCPYQFQEVESLYNFWSLLLRKIKWNKTGGRWGTEGEGMGKRSTRQSAVCFLKTQVRSLKESGLNHMRGTTGLHYPNNQIWLLCPLFLAATYQQLLIIHNLCCQIKVSNTSNLNVQFVLKFDFFFYQKCTL